MQKHELLDELRRSGIGERVISAMKDVRRENFVLHEDKRHAYSNNPLPIHEGQTISQPLTVALMTQWLDVRPGNRILEVGAGSGYQAAVLAELSGPGGKVTTCEVREKLFEFARKNLAGWKNVEVVHADASKGYVRRNSLTSSNISKELRSFADDGEFDRIIVTASASQFPDKLAEHLKEGGRMVVPVGDEMWLIEKKGGMLKKEMTGYFSFVPLVE
ncbi:MAG: methyltransferase domain-containing protein [Candidatus Aenigmarchaeota archaeon]|nr:methyltransferase domain-containing protein [Candidatus Aenigmarchaeota archaeon]